MIAEFISSQADYICFFAGLMHILLAAVCHALNRRPERRLSWGWLGLFAAGQGAGMWLTLVVMGLGQTFFFAAMRLATLTLSFLFLVEFGRSGTVVIRGRGPGRWVLLPLLCLPALAVWGGVQDPALFIDGTLGLTAGTWAALVLFRAAGFRLGRNHAMTVAAVAVACYTLTLGLGAVGVAFCADWIGGRGMCYGPFAGLGQGIQGLLMGAATIALWRHSQGLLRAGASFVREGLDSRYMSRMVVGCVAALVGGWMLTEMVGRYADADVRYHLDTRARTIADCLNRGQVVALTGSSADLETAQYVSLKGQLSELRRLNPDCRFVYLMARRGGRVVFLADSEPADSKDYSPPGEVYEEPSPALMSIFDFGRPFVEGPVEDAWGVWLSGHAPVRAPGTDRVLAVVGMDIDAGNWRREIAVHRLAPITISMLIVTLLVGFFVAQQKSWESSLRISASETRYRALFNGGNDAVFVHSVPWDGGPGRFIEVNDMACIRLGYTREELMRLSPADIHDNRKWSDTAAALGEVRKNEHVLFETVHVARDGRRIRVEMNARLFDLHGQPAVLSVARDVTERRALERQLVQAQKLESLGQLAAGVAHEINNPMAFIASNLATLDEYRRDITDLLNGYFTLEGIVASVVAPSANGTVAGTLAEIETVKDRMNLEFVLGDFHKIIAESREGTERVKSIVRNLKDFAHVDEVELGHADINQGLDSTLNIVWNEIKYKATVSKDYGDLPPVYCHPQQINQVFMNILVNAAQAIEHEGEVKIETRFLDGDRPTVAIRIEDTGPGIPSENIETIFEPFFTTKPVGKGTGLGLSIAHKIVTAHRGDIRVESEPGEGTAFVIVLPVKGPEPEVLS